jgi:hypothetical protein
MTVHQMHLVVRGGSKTLLEAGREVCHLTLCGWDSQVCGEFYFHDFATVDVFYTTITTFSYVLMCSDIVHGGKSPFAIKERPVVSVWVHEEDKMAKGVMK